MKLTKKTYVMILLNLIILSLLGNEALNTFLHINLLVTVLNYLLPGLLCIFLLYDIFKQRYLPLKKTSTALTLLFWIFLLISFACSISHEIFNCSNLFKFGCMTFILLIVKDAEFEDKQKKGLIYTLLASSAFISLIGIGQYVFKVNLNISGIEKYVGALGRINSTTYIATILDKYLVLNIFIALYLIYKKLSNKLITYAVLILNVLALTFTFSRTGLLIFIFLVFVFVLIFVFKKQFFNALLLILITVAMYYIPGQNFVYSSLAKYLVNVSVRVADKVNMSFINSTAKFVLDPFIIDIYEYLDKERPQEEGQKNPNQEFVIEEEISIDEEIDVQLTSDVDYSLSSRSYYKDIASDLMKKYWKCGIGIGSYTYLYNNQNVNDYLNGDPYTSYFRYPHNMYLQLGAEVGIIGMLIFFANIIFVFLKRSINSKSIFPLILCISIFLICYTESIFYMKDIAYFTIILIALFANKYFLEDKTEVIVSNVDSEMNKNEKKKTSKRKNSTKTKNKIKKKANSK